MNPNVRLGLRLLWGVSILLAQGFPTEEAERALGWARWAADYFPYTSAHAPGYLVENPAAHRIHYFNLDSLLPTPPHIFPGSGGEENRGFILCVRLDKIFAGDFGGAVDHIGVCLTPERCALGIATCRERGYSAYFLRPKGRECHAQPFRCVGLPSC